MNFLYDYFPIVCFFIAYKLKGIYWATGVAMGASALQVAIYWWRHRKFDRTHLITLILIFVLGGMTLLFHNPIFIQWKPSVIYWLFSIVLFGSHFVGNKMPILQRLLGKKAGLPASAWKVINSSWAWFFLIMGFINIYVVYHYTMDQWVNFKLFGTLGATLVFALVQALYIYRKIR